MVWKEGATSQTLHISDFLERKPFDLQTSAISSQEHWSAGASFYPNRRLTSFWRLRVSACCRCCCCGLRAKLQIRQPLNTHSGNCRIPCLLSWLLQLYSINFCSIFIRLVSVFVLLSLSVLSLFNSGKSGRKTCVCHSLNMTRENNMLPCFTFWGSRTFYFP